MQVEEDRFFRKAALLICADLEIEKAMSSLLQFLRQVMPADTMFLEYYDPGFSAMRTIAKATRTDCTRLDLLTPLSDEARKTISETSRSTTMELVERVADHDSPVLSLEPSGPGLTASQHPGGPAHFPARRSAAPRTRS